jgi:hypothetical protein
MKVKLYEQLCVMNQGFDQVRRSLKELAKHSFLEPSEIRRFQQLTEEARAATNSYLLEVLGTEETDRAGRLFVQRKARERREEQRSRWRQPMKGLYIVRKRVTASEPGGAADRALWQLAALDRAKDSVHATYQRLATAADRAAKLCDKMEGGMERFIQAWNAAHPDQTIQRCCGIVSTSACLRYTLNADAFCDACRSTRGKR